MIQVTLCTLFPVVCFLPSAKPIEWLVAMSFLLRSLPLRHLPRLDQPSSPQWVFWMRGSISILQPNLPSEALEFVPSPQQIGVDKMVGACLQVTKTVFHN